MSWRDGFCRLGRRIGHGLSWRRRHLLWRLAVRWAVVRTALRWAARAPGRPHGLAVPLVVSLTSYPPRFPTLALTLQCLLTQDLRPDRVVLWVAHADLALLPPSVLALRRAGLTIFVTEDLRSYKKIIPALEAFSDAVIVTADDDLYYPADWLRHLVTGWEGRPDRIVCRRAHLIGRDEDGGLRPYCDWAFETLRDEDSAEIFPTGVGGVLYPPGSLHPDVLDRATFLDLCPQADDVWLYWMGRRNGMRYRRVGDRAGLVFWDGTQEVALWNDNLAQDANDRQIARMLARYGLPGAAPMTGNRNGTRGEGTTMPDLIDVSIVIAAYNAEPFIARAIASALDQREVCVEILVADDASGDGTREVVSRLAVQCPRIRLLPGATNQGPAAARNRAIDAARGEWIAILDADDAILPDRLSRLLAIARETGADIVSDNFRYYDPATDTCSPPALPERDTPREIDLADFLDHARPYGEEPDWGLLKPIFRRAFLERHRLRYPLHSRHGEDFLLMVALLAQGGRHVYSPVCGYLYTRRDFGWSRTRVDYDAMARQSRTLLRDSAIAGDPRLVALVRVRIQAVRRLAFEYRLGRYRRERRRVALVGLVVRTPALWLRALRRVVKEVAGAPR